MVARASRTPSPLVVTAALMAANVLLASGFAVTGLIQPEAVLPHGQAPSSASMIFAGYAAARTLPLGVCALIAIWKRSISGVVILGAVTALIQIADASVGLLQHDPAKTIGPLAIGVAQLLSVGWLIRRGEPA
jgi:hypothetical protein